MGEKEICVPLSLMRRIKNRNKEHIAACEEYLVELKKIEQKLFDISLENRNKEKALKIANKRRLFVNKKFENGCMSLKEYEDLMKHFNEEDVE